MQKRPYRALLLDLDGTLLDIDMERLIGAYIETLAPLFGSYISPEQFARHLLESTVVMVRNTDPAKTNVSVFFDEFCRRLGQPYELVYPIFERYYESGFPLLKRWSKPLPEAGAVIEAARRKGLRLVLATNPIFPLRAIEHRLEWARLSSAAFDLITTVDNMHFCKPQPEYYLEIAAMIGIPPEHCLMAGNDVEEDISSAAATGMGTFLADRFLIHRRPGEEPPARYRGSLQDLADLIASFP
ncbi:MAG: HAD family hydrolase [Firmicutes bacterium]|nr:HAD family hydrolase [Bacillota bacterium]